MTRRALVIGLGLALGVSGTAARADEPSTAGMKAEIEVLKDRLSSLENKLASQEASAAGASSGNAIIQLPSGLHGINLSGFVDTSYTYSFNEPNSRATTLRVFDTRAGDFMLNNVELALEKPVSAESPVGFRTDLHFGTDAEVTGGVTTGLGITNNELDIQQGYVEYLAPIGNGLDIKVGKFCTLHGAEVTESKDNWNFSHTWLFGFAEPLTHTGVRATYAWNDRITTMFGVNNGWDVVDDNNKAKSIELGATILPIEHVTLSTAYMVGAEQGSGGTASGDSHDQRHLWTIVVGYDPIERLHLKAAFDYGREEDALAEGVDGANASWNGVALYAKYDLSDVWSVTGRWEVFNDQDGARTLVNATGTSPTSNTIADLQLFGYTLTTEYKFNPHLIGRLEYRLDKASSAVFAHDQGAAAASFLDYQNTVAVEFIAPF